MKKKRRIYEVRYSRKARRWFWTLRGVKPLVTVRTKAEAEAMGRTLAKNHAPSQLLIYNRDDKIGKGGRSEASYGCDSPRRRG